jgi:uncharacterized membrane protein YfcA
LLGALIGARIMMYLSNKTLRLIFIPIMMVVAIQMVLRGLGASFH